MAPAFAIALAVLAGAAAGVTTTAVTPIEALACALLLASLALAAGRGAPARALILAALLCAAAAHGAFARERALAPPLSAWFDAAGAAGDRVGDVVAVDGYLRTDAALVEGGVRLTIDVTSLRTDDGRWTRAPGRVQAHVAGLLAAVQASAWTAGRRIRAPVRLRRPPVAVNPGGPNLLWQALRRPFDLTGAIKSAALIEIDRGTWLAEWAAAARRFVRAAIARHVPDGSHQAAGIVTAILIGDRAGLSDEVQRRLQAAGTYHVIAISGGNVALLTALVFAATRLLLRSPRAGSLVAVGFVLAYGFVVGGEASVTRAVTAACLYLGSGVVGLAPRSLYVLATTAIVITIADPIAVIDVGAWLSFGAALGIILVARRLTDAVVGHPDGAGPRSPAPLARRRAWVLMPRVLVGLLAASIAAELALLPIAASVFSRVGIAGLVVNFAAIPAMTVAQLAGMAAVAASVVWPHLASTGGAVAGRAAEILVGSAQLVELFPALSWRVPPPSLVWIGVYYMAVTAAMVPHSRLRPRRVAMAIAAAALIVIVTAPFTTRLAPGAGRLRVSIFDVGQGEAMLVQFPSGQSMLIDAGGGPGVFDVGDRVVTPAAWAMGVRRLTWLVVTHGDQDHVGGATSVAETLAPAEIWEGVPVPPHPELAALRQLAQTRGAVWRRAHTGESFEIAGVAVDVLHPPRPEWERQRVRNDDSVVIRLRYGAADFLLTGDAGAEFEAAALMDADLGPLRVLKVGHHGSRTSTSAGLLSRFLPQMAIISAGRGNLFGHPAPDVVRRLEAAGVELFRTDRDGAVILETDGASVEVKTMGGRVWRLGLWWSRT